MENLQQSGHSGPLSLISISLGFISGFSAIHFQTGVAIVAGLVGIGAGIMSMRSSYFNIQEKKMQILKNKQQNGNN